MTLSTAILLIAFAFRICRLLVMPLYIDEATHIMWSYDAAKDNILIGIGDNKFLFPAILALFNPYGPESPFLGRMVSVFAGVVTVSACLTLGRMLGGKRIGLLAGLLSALAPMLVFLDRQALIDPLLT
nr:hypothetical protein [Anaerolineae bacterium]